MTIVLDPARSDLLVDAELARFADVCPRYATRAADNRGAGAAAGSWSRRLRCAGE